MFNIQQVIDDAIEKAVQEALIQDAAADEAQIAAIRAECAQQIQAALAADAEQDNIILKAKNDEIDRLNTLVINKDSTIAELQTRIAELETQNPPSPVPTVSLSANPNPVVAGQSTALSWASNNATSCVGSGFNANGLSGSVSVSPSTNTVYSIQATGPGGITSANVSLIVNVPTPPSSDFNPRTMTLSQIQAATGVRVPITTLKKSGGVTISTPGVYENMDYTGRVTIETTGKVVFRNCRFNGGGDYYAIINVPEKFTAEEIRFEFCEIRNALNCIAGANLYIYRCNILEWENGVNFWGPGQLVESYIHDQKQIFTSPHFDGIECNGGGNIKILRSYIINSAGQTSALMFNNEFSPLHDIEIDGNYLAGGGYTVYFDTNKSPNSLTTNIKVTNNTLKKGFYGHTALYNSSVKIDASGGNQLI